MLPISFDTVVALSFGTLVSKCPFDCAERDLFIISEEYLRGDSGTQDYYFYYNYNYNYYYYKTITFINIFINIYGKMDHLCQLFSGFLIIYFFCDFGS